MRKAYRFRIYPSEEERRILEQTLNTCRILYNNLLAERRDTYKKTGRSPSYYKQKRGLTRAEKLRHSIYSQVSFQKSSIPTRWQFVPFECSASKCAF